MSSQNNQEVSVQDKELIMREIEKKGEQIVSAAIKTSQICNPMEIIIGVEQNNEKLENSQQICLNIIKQGGAEFEQRVGRQMTYSEMRAMFG